MKLNIYDYIGLISSVTGLGALLCMFGAGCSAGIGAKTTDTIWAFMISLIIAIISAIICSFCEKRGNLFK